MASDDREQYKCLGTRYIFEFTYDNLWTGASIPKKHWHFHARLLQRYDIVLAPGEFSDLIKSITTGRATLVEHRRNGTSIYAYVVKSASERIYVLAKRDKVISVWPREKRLNAKRRALIKSGGNRDH